jgi:PII-like signaling protein
MSKENALRIYNVSREAAEPVRDADLVRLAEVMPEIVIVLEEVQALRRLTDDLQDRIDHA